MSKIAWIIFGVIVVVVLGGAIVFSRLNSPSIDVSDIDTNATMVGSKQNGNIADHTFGKTDSKVVLIEYGDFQCPSCGGAHPQVKEVTEAYKDRVLFIFRNFPITSAHPNARAAAAAVEAAGLQGKYWEMHNLIFESQDTWSSLTGSARTQQFTDYAVSLGLDKDRFLADLGSDAVNQKISFDQALAKKLGVNATPTFYLNGKPLETATANATVQGSSTELKAALDAALGQ